MQLSFSGRTRIAVALALGAPLLLAGCSSGVTYGTGRSASIQTLEDVSGIVSLSNTPKQEIAYRPRGGIVVPPTATLPPPGTGGTAIAAANWPTDPDEALREHRTELDRIRAQQNLEAQEEARRDPGFRLAQRARTQRSGATGTAEAGGMQQLADLRRQRGGSVDSGGAPTRRYLTEPPADYRQRDPSAAATVTPAAEKKSGFARLWPFGK